MPFAGNEIPNGSKHERSRGGRCVLAVTGGDTGGWNLARREIGRTIDDLTTKAAQYLTSKVSCLTSTGFLWDARKAFRSISDCLSCSPLFLTGRFLSVPVFIYRPSPNPSRPLPSLIPEGKRDVSLAEGLWSSALSVGKQELRWWTQPPRFNTSCKFQEKGTPRAFPPSRGPPRSSRALIRLLRAPRTPPQRW